MEILPSFIIDFEKKTFVKIVKFLGSMSMFFILSGLAHKFNIIFYYITFLMSLFYILYQIILSFYAIIGYINIIRKGKFIVRKFPLDLLTSCLKLISITSKVALIISISVCFAYVLTKETFSTWLIILDETNKNISELINSIKDLIFPDFSLLYEFLDSLSLLKESAVFHLLVLLVIMAIIFNIYSVLFGNEIIKYFKLEENYPKLNIFFKLRIKFQRFYLNLILIICICIFAIGLNILVLVKI